MTLTPTTHRLTCTLTLCLMTALGLSACASKPKATTEADGRVIEHKEAVTDRVGGAMLTPLSDLNMVRTEIPDVLQDAVDHGAYHPPQELSCVHIGEQIVLLNAALGSDLDAPKGGDVASWLDRGSDFAEDSGVGMVRRTVEGVVPFRSWLRKLSGAERHSRKVSQAIVTGGIRRAFLKGVGAQLGCPPPAAPLSVAAPPSTASAPQP